MTPKNEVAVREAGGAIDAVQKPVTPTDILLNAFARAVQTNTDAATMKEQMAMLEKLMAAKAKESYDAAMTRFKAAVPPVIKTKKVEGLYSYAPLDSVVRQVKPALEAEGFTWDFDQEAAPSGSITGVCIAKNSGHSERRAVTLPISSGNRASNATKDAAGALSFAQRRAFQNAFGIVIEGEDYDAHSVQQRGPSRKTDTVKSEPAQPSVPDTLRDAKSRLWELLKDVRGTFPAGTKPNWEAAEFWLRKHKILKLGEKVSELDAAGLAEAYDKASIQIDQDKGLL